MAKAAVSVGPRTASDFRTRRASNEPGVARSPDATKHGTDAKRRNSTLRSIVAAIEPRPRDARICIPERRWRESPFVLVERRKGPRWKYGSIVVCAALWAQVWWLFHK
jgi:hypothetical protein